MLAGTSGGVAGWAAMRAVPAWISLDSAEKLPLMGTPATRTRRRGGRPLVLGFGSGKMLQYKL
jgi:hypothetical protein